MSQSTDERHPTPWNGFPRTTSTLNRIDVLGGSLICTAMLVMFWFLGEGWSLRVTFVPGALAAWVIIVVMWRRQAPVAAAERVLPLYMVSMAWQLLHFAEESHTGFWHRFPELYGGQAYSQALFTWFNMGAYAAFLMSTVAVFVLRFRALMMPSLFFVTYGMLGNAIAHLMWSIMVVGYFPGLVTALAYFLLGPLLLHRLSPALTWRVVSGVFAILATVMVPVLGVGVSR